MNRIHRHLSTVTALTSLERYGKQSSSTYGRIDSLTYTYNGNQLTASCLTLKLLDHIHIEA
jgi:hypothetical protein